jgi:hypothetical protein
MIPPVDFEFLVLRAFALAVLHSCGSVVACGFGCGFDWSRSVSA